MLNRFFLTIIISFTCLIGISVLEHEQIVIDNSEFDNLEFDNSEFDNLEFDRRGIDEYAVSRCKGGDRVCSYRSRPIFSRCFFGTSKNNTYCCNPRTLNKTVPSKNELFKPTVCCSADGSGCFSGTLCCSGGCTRKGKKNGTTLGVCSINSPPDHNQIRFRRCSRGKSGVCRSGSEYDSCYNGTSTGNGISTGNGTSTGNGISTGNGTSTGNGESIPDIVSLTCCKSSLLHGRLPTTEQFLSDTCCLPKGQTCLIDDTCCSKQCLGLRGPDTSGNCSGSVLTEESPNTSTVDHDGDDLNNTNEHSNLDHRPLVSTTLSPCDLNHRPLVSTTLSPCDLNHRPLVSTTLSPCNEWTPDSTLSPSTPQQVHHHHYHHHHIPRPPIYGISWWLPFRGVHGGFEAGSKLSDKN